MEPVSNPHRTALHNDSLPDGPLTTRQRALVDAVRFCKSLSDFSAAHAEVVTSITIARVQLDTPADLAERHVRDGIAKARTELDRLERVLNAHGVAAFSPQVEPVAARCVGTPETRHDVIARVLRHVSDTGRVLVRAGDSRVTRGGDGAYVVQAHA